MYKEYWCAKQKDTCHPVEEGVAIKGSWDEVMHTTSSKIIINAAKQMQLEVVLDGGTEIVHLDTTDDLLSHLIPICRYNVSDNHSQDVAINVWFDANRSTGGVRQLILYLLCLC